MNPRSQGGVLCFMCHVDLQIFKISGMIVNRMSSGQAPFLPGYFCHPETGLRK